MSLKHQRTPLRKRKNSKQNRPYYIQTRDLCESYKEMKADNTFSKNIKIIKKKKKKRLKKGFLR